MTTITRNPVMMIEGPVLRRTFPFSQETLDKIADIRDYRQGQYEEEYHEAVMIPAPIIIQEAIDRLYEELFQDDESY